MQTNANFPPNIPPPLNEEIKEEKKARPSLPSPEDFCEVSQNFIEKGICPLNLTFLMKKNFLLPILFSLKVKYPADRILLMEEFIEGDFISSPNKTHFATITPKGNFALFEGDCTRKDDRTKRMY